MSSSSKENRSDLTAQKFQMLAEYVKKTPEWAHSYLSNHDPVYTQGTVQGQVCHFTIYYFILFVTVDYFKRVITGYIIIWVLEKAEFIDEDILKT